MKISPVLHSNMNIQPAKNLDNLSRKFFATNVLQSKPQAAPVSFKWYTSGSSANFKRNFASIEDWLNYNLNFKCNEDFHPNELSKLLTANDSMQKFSSDLYSETRSKTYSKGGITVGQFVDLLKKQELIEPNKILSSIKNEHLNKPDVIKTSIEVKQSYLKFLIDELSKLDPDADFLKVGKETMTNIANNYYQKIDEDFSKYNQTIKEKLKYSEDSKVEPFDLLTEIKKLPQEKQYEIEQKFNGDYNKMMRHYIAERCASSYCPIKYSETVDSALIQMLPRYLQEKDDNVFEIAPMSRRLSINDYDDFMKQFKVGENYSFNLPQSTAKDMQGAESYFRDSARHQNVIFRIHPKSKLTKAYDVKNIDAYEETKDEINWDDVHSRYFSSEVLYIPNQQFKFLGSHKYVKNTYMFGCNIPDCYKTIIDLQEI